VTVPPTEQRRGLPPLVDGAIAEQRRTLRELASELGLTGRDLAVVLVQPRRVAVDPRLDLEAVPTDGVHGERAREPVVAERCEWFLPPAAIGRSELSIFSA
jgi:hypothetical protein